MRRQAEGLRAVNGYMRTLIKSDRVPIVDTVLRASRTRPWRGAGSPFAVAVRLAQANSPPP
jgi:hypothetical protein